MACQRILMGAGQWLSQLPNVLGPIRFTHTLHKLLACYIIMRQLSMNLHTIAI